MRDRLIELLMQAETEADKQGSYICFVSRDKAEYLADHILADGWIRLPCKEGDTMYCIIPKCNAPYNYCPYNGGYGTARCDKEPCKAYIKEISFSLSDIENIGKTVFLTKEEAERALAERSEK